MSTSKQSRISTVASEFAAFMQRTDNLQLAVGTPTTTRKWQNWGWTLGQSQQWTAYRNQCDLLYPLYADKKRVNTETTDEMNILIAVVKKYDNDPLTGARLLDKVATNGTISDCETFQVKRGSALAAVSHQGASTARNVGGLVSGPAKPVLATKKYDVGEHLISVTNPNTPKSHALPSGIKFAKVYRFIGTVAPTSINQYVFVGNAKRGSVLSSFTSADLTVVPVGTEVFAWYIARYESSKGVLGDACGAIRAQILRP
ncbi:MAG TPA: hypothetical protein VF411_04175 [Bacteroidia bacterium]